MSRTLVGIIALTAILAAVGYLLLSNGSLEKSAHPASEPVPEETQPVATTLSADQIATLSSLVKIDELPMYVMHYVGDYRTNAVANPVTEHEAFAYLRTQSLEDSFACSVFAADGRDAPVLGRNFDWDHDPVLLLFTNPTSGYASMSLVDLAYFIPGDEIAHLDSVDLEDRVGLLGTPMLPFDGMNEMGLAIGMAALSASPLPSNPSRETKGSIEVIRDALDQAATVVQAIEIITSVNISMIGGPPIHYLVADTSGDSAIIELGNGETHIFRQEGTWQAMTNFRLHDVPEAERPDTCWRYSSMMDALIASDGDLAPEEAMAILEGVAWESEENQAGTLWSTVYDLRSRTMRIALLGNYGSIWEFGL